MLASSMWLDTLSYDSLYEVMGTFPEGIVHVLMGFAHFAS